MLTKLAMVRDALQAMGAAPAEELCAFIEKKHGVRIEPKFIPVFRASLEDKLRLEAERQAARRPVQQMQSESQVG